VTSKDEPPTPKGSVFAIKMDNGQDLQVYYVSGGSKSGIVVFQDIFSIRVFAPESKSTDRTVAICDTLADAGYSVVLPDLFGKEPFDFCTPLPDESKGEDFINRNAFGLEGAPEWFGTKTGYYNHKPTVIAAVDYLVDKIGKDAPLGCLGFCFGNWLMSKAQFEGDAKFTCGVGCHPSTALENMHMKWPCCRESKLHGFSWRLETTVRFLRAKMELVVLLWKQWEVE
jgi:dienelactone hydrolase